MKYVYITILLLMALFLAAFIQQNGTAIQLKYFYWSTPYLPVSLYMILCFFTGWIFAMVAGFAAGIRFRLRASGAEREARQLRSELDQLKQQEVRSVGARYDADPGEPPAGAKQGQGADDPGTLRGSAEDSFETGAQTRVVGTGGEEKE